MNHHPKPFDCEFSPQFAELLSKMGISLAVSTYQAGKVVMISPTENDKLIQLPRNFHGAMGMAASDDKIAVACTNEVVVLKNEAQLAKSYPTKPGVYDAIYLPRSTYHTSYLALHDMEFISNNKLIAVNTLFSCLCEINEEKSFTPFWQPPFISELKPEDRCHLNGMAVDNNEIKYLTALGKGNSNHEWRENKMNGGILMSYPDGEIILDNLSMPHSPRVYDNELYLLNSAQGELIKVDVTNKTYEVIVKLGGFARGMVRYGDYLFIGVSKLRHNSKVFADLPIAKTSFAGVIAVYLPYKTIIGSIKYQMSVDEIYDVKVIPSLRPSILSSDMEVHKQAYSTGKESFWMQPKTNSTNNTPPPQTENRAAQQPAPAGTYSTQMIKDVSPTVLSAKFSSLINQTYIEGLSPAEKNRNITAVVVVFDQKPAAMAILDINPDRTYTVPSFMVSPEHQNRGVDNYLTKQIEIIVQHNKMTPLNTINR